MSTMRPYTVGQVLVRNAVLGVTQTMHDAPITWDRTLVSCSDLCLACAVEAFLWQHEHPDEKGSSPQAPDKITGEPR